MGRLPIVTTLRSLDRKALLNILTEPKNAIIKQYKKLLRMEGVELEFDQEAVACPLIGRLYREQRMRQIFLHRGNSTITNTKL